MVASKGTASSSSRSSIPPGKLVKSIHQRRRTIYKVTEAS
jgi:DNA-directed RNA polymerase specialized sigma54-like protein